MGVPKPLLKLEGKSFLRTIVDRHKLCGLSVCVVLGQHNQDLTDRVDLSDVTVLLNPEPSRGALSSLHIALDHFGERDGLLIHPVDHPLVTAGTVEQLLEHHRRLPASILLPSVHGRKGHPVLFPRRYFFALKRAPMAQGARWVVRQNPGSTFLVSVDDWGILMNVNTRAEARRVMQHHAVI